MSLTLERYSQRLAIIKKVDQRGIMANLSPLEKTILELRFHRNPPVPSSFIAEMHHTTSSLVDQHETMMMRKLIRALGLT